MKKLTEKQAWLALAELYKYRLTKEEPARRLVKILNRIKYHGICGNIKTLLAEERIDDLTYSTMRAKIEQEAYARGKLRIELIWYASDYQSRIDFCLERASKQAHENYHQTKIN